MAKLANAPVCYTTAQISFNEVSAIDSVLPALSEAFHGMGLLDHQPIKSQGLEVRQDNNSFSFSQTETVRHAFRNKAETSVVLLGPDSLAYETTEYPVFDEFRKTFITVIARVHEQRPIEYCDRLGMRMLDAIQPQHGDTLEQYINPQALGLGTVLDEDWTHQHSLTESSFQRGGNILNIRTYVGQGGVAVPPDLSPPRLKIRQRFTEHAGDTLMLDSDSFQSERCDFELDDIAGKMKALKSALSTSFKTMTTDYARKAWE